MLTLVAGLVLAASSCRQWLDLDRFEEGSNQNGSAGSSSAGSGGAGGSMGSAGAAGMGGSQNVACSRGPAGGLYVFVSAATVTPSAHFTSVVEAGALCREWAAEAGLGGDWNAWLSETGTAAPTQLLPATGPWHRCDGQVVISSSTSLSMLVVPINLDEYGRVVRRSYVWTGTRADLMLGDSCNDWDTGASPNLGTVGSVDATDGSWTESATLECDGLYRLYCFQTSS